jgi:TRAP-type C4-dicarboxylate transport system permease small subunit
MNIILKISNIFGRALEIFIIFLLVLMTVLMFAQVAGRYLFKNGIFWAEELARFIMVTMVYLGAGLACKNKDHIKVTVLEEFLKGGVYKIYRILMVLISISFLSVLVYYGFSVLSVVRTQLSANLQVPMHYVYAVMPIGACIMIFYLIVELLEIVLAKGDERP